MTDRHVRIYKDSHGELRWSLVHQNGNILGDSGEGYANKADILDTVSASFHDIPIIDETETND